ncbi:MAG: cell division protein FtsA [Bacteroidaceae bacterium]|nr:cell division protein FtsA [Bacteroidaceae bacterium]
MDMAFTDKDFVVAIELGSSKISAIAGRKKDGTMQVLAYAEEKTNGCVKRGIVFNIDKTYQCINNVLNKLENVLKTKITRAYVGLGGQSVRSFRCLIKRNLLTQSYITTELIDGIRQDSYEIPFSDYEVLENFPQEYYIDQNVVAEPVGVMGTNIEGEYMDVIAKQKLRNNIKTAFANSGVDIAEELISPLELADNILADSEKRSGCVLIDLGAETTTVLVYKNNIVRYLVTIPLGMNNVNKDLASIQIDDAEAEEIKLKYGDLEVATAEEDLDEPQTYTSTDGRKFEVALLKAIIHARVTEIIANVNNQVVKSNYNGKLLAGIILTGGGSNMKGIDKAFMASINVDKCRIARTVSQPIIKTSNAPSFTSDNAMTNTIVSLLLAGTQPCGGGEYEGQDLFGKAAEDDARTIRLQEQKAKEEAEKKDAVAFDEVKMAIREEYEKVKKAIEEVERYGNDKAVRQRAKDLTLSALDVLGESYQTASAALEDKEKFKQSLSEGTNLAKMLRDEVDKLTETVNRANRENSFFGRARRWLDDVVNEG